MPSYRVLSSDSHVVEPPDLWTSRIEARYAEKAPQVIYGATELGDWWYADGVRLFSALMGADTGVRFDDPAKIRTEARYDEVRPGGYDPTAKLKDMEIDGVSGEVVYPTIGLLVYWLRDSGLLSAICRAYNDWAAEFGNQYPDRIKGLAMVNLDDIDEGVRELERAARLGLKGSMISVFPPEERGYDSPIYDPF